MPGTQQARQGRRQRDAARHDLPRRKQLAHPPQGHTAHIWVAWIVHREVVPQHGPTRAQPAPHGTGQLLLKSVVEQGRKNRGLHDDVLAAWGNFGAQRVAQKNARCAGQNGTRLSVALGQ